MSLVKEILVLIIRKNADSLPNLKEQRPDAHAAVLALKANIFTYSMLFKVMHIDIKKHRNTS
jgi:hypothetical protein